VPEESLPINGLAQGTMFFPENRMIGHFADSEVVWSISKQYGFGMFGPNGYRPVQIFSKEKRSNFWFLGSGKRRI